MIKEFEMGMTVRDLKELIKDWPETDKYGEPAEVWVETTPGLSSPVRLATTLNGTDILLGDAS
jgi:hypothetical protein